MPGSSPGMTIVGAAPPRSQTHVRAPRREAPESCMKLSPHGGRGECRVPAAPAASCALVVVERTRVTTSTPERPAFPHAMVLTAYVVLSPVTGLFCHRRLADIWLVRTRLGRLACHKT